LPPGASPKNAASSARDTDGSGGSVDRGFVMVRAGRRLLAAAALAAAFLTAFPASPWTAAEALAADYVFLIDCTGTMRYHGRAEAVTEALDGFIDTLAPGDCVTFLGYGEDAQPLTSEYPIVIDASMPRDAVKRALNPVFDDNRTDITRGMELAWSERELVFPRAIAGGRGAATGFVVLVTDGKLIPVYDDYSQYDRIYRASRARLLELAGLFGGVGVQVHTVGLGPSGTIDGDLLKEIAAASGGAYRHAASSADLAGAFREIEQATVGGGREAAAAASDDVAPAREAGESGSPVVETAAAAQARHRPPRSIVLSYTTSSLISWAYHATAGILGVFLGFLAIGIHRRQHWTRVFTQPLLRHEVRVRGYLRPVFPPGVKAARACVPLENPGLPTLEIGAGTVFCSDLSKTRVEFVGTSNGDTPLLRVIKGKVSVDGEEVSQERRLRDGDVIQMEDQTYVYLRGSRR
jgi:Mg-chelatase subunit ChlD